MTTLEDALYNQKKYGILQAPTANNGNSTATIHSAATANELEITLQNNTNAGVVYSYVTGLDIDRNNAVFVLRSDGVTRYYPGSPGNDNSPLPEDCHIRLNRQGENRRVTIPRLVGGRIWFCRDDKLTFLLNRGPALVQPSVMNRSDPNYNKDWGFAEFTFNSFQIFANITYVDFVGLPISLALTSRNGGQTQKVTGIPENGLSSICSELVEQNNRDRAGWDQLVVKTSRGTPLRALSPNSGINMNESLFRSYYQPYVNAVWAKYSSSALTLNTQGQWGVLKGQVTNGRLSFNVGSFPQPSAKDVFSCDSGAFTNKNDAMGNVTARLAAAFNRSTLLTNTNQPDGETIASYYRDSITNHYSRIVHKYNSDGRGYAFPYDDVAPSDRENVAGTVADQNPGEFVVAVGGPARLSGTSRVMLREMAGVGGRSGQKVGGRQERVRRGLEWSEMEGEDEKAVVLVRREVGEVQPQGLGVSVVDLEGQGGGKMEAERGRLQAQLVAPGTVEAVRRRVEIMLERIAERNPALVKYVGPVVEGLGKTVVAVLSLSVRALVSRVVAVLLLIALSFFLGFFGHSGKMKELVERVEHADG